MEYNKSKVDEAILALLYLTLHKYNRAWKGHSWDALNRLYEKGFIENPRGKVKSVVLTEEGKQYCEELFKKLFQAAE